MDEAVDVEADIGSTVAIVGMSGRFPGANDVDALWEHVAAGDDCLTDVSTADLVAAGDATGSIGSEGYVARGGRLDDVAGFDAPFFGIGRRDASLMDPQHRHFLECAWEALESAAIVPRSFDGSIGVFGGCGMNTYLINNLLTAPGLLDQVGWFLLRHTGNDKDFLVNEVAYRLDLRGPAVNVQTACSTSLVAVHLAVQSLLSFECDAALAGGATIEVPHAVGYHFREGEILAPDGRCRAFDEQSAGTVLTSGVGVVVLRRLEDALADGDPILALIRGSAVNNDGSRKVGFLAPSVDGHADVVREALTVAGLSARDIQLLEAHGTGTAVGDPIEIAALTEAFRSWTDDTAFCRLASTKPNIGHLDTAAGVASLIKVVQSLRHAVLPGLANHTAPSPIIDIASTPFVVTRTPSPWPDSEPRRAGVSSLGVGGTNAHVVVEEAPRVGAVPEADGPFALLLSARTATALERAGDRLARHVAERPELALADVAHTLNVGRDRMSVRRVVTATSRGDAVAALRRQSGTLSHDATVADAPPGVAFMFPGGGSQYPGMGAGLSGRFETFRHTRTEGASLVRELGGPDLMHAFRGEASFEQTRRPTMALPMVFLTSLALARQCIDIGLDPSVMIGHSLGEYVAAHLAGVMSLEDAVSLVITRSRLMEESAGEDAAMLAIPISEAALRDQLPVDLSIATVNAEDECVIAGRRTDVLAFASVLEASGISGTVLPLSAAAHSSLLDPLLPSFRQAVESVTLSPPTRPYPSNVTGTWITPDQATDPGYWVDHLRGTVRFADCLQTAIDPEVPMVLLEVGPGQALSSYARRLRPRPKSVVPMLRHPDHEIADDAFTTHAVAQLWAAGAAFDTDWLVPPRPQRVVLPGYAFDHERHWIDPGVRPEFGSSGSLAKPREVPELERIDDPDRATWIPTWQRLTLAPDGSDVTGQWTVVGDDDDPFVDAIAAELEERGATVETVASSRGRSMWAAGPMVVVAPLSVSYEKSFERWLVDAVEATRHSAATGAPLYAVTRSAAATTGPAARPFDAMAVGVVLVAPKEYPELTARLVDVDESIDAAGLVDVLLSDGPAVLALHGDGTFSPELDRRPLPTQLPDERAFQEGGTYVVTGGLGAVGQALAGHLISDYGAHVVITSSSPMPPRTEWEAWRASHSFDDPTSRRIRRLVELERLGGKVSVVVADLSDESAVARAFETIDAEAGSVDGVVHAAGVVHDRLLEFADVADHHCVVDPKVVGAAALVAALKSRGGGLLVLVSSTSTVLAPPGQTSYVAANAVLDAMAGTPGVDTAVRVVTIDFGLWSMIGIASEAGRRLRLGIGHGDPVRHPILHEEVRRSDGRIEMVGRLTADHHWLVDEHRTVDGRAVLPATGHLELMLAAIASADLPSELHSVAFLDPLFVDDGVATYVRVTVEPKAGGLVRVESDAGGSDAWRLHSEGRSGDGGQWSTTPEAPSDTEIVGDPLVQQRRHLQLGPRWASIGTVSRSALSAVSRVSLDEAVRGETNVWHAHPAVADLAIATGALLGDVDNPDILYVPTGVAVVRTDGPLPADVSVQATLADGSSDRLLVFDVACTDSRGRVRLQLEGVEMIPVAEGRLHRDASESLDHATPPPTAGTALIALADRLGLQMASGVELLERVVLSGLPRVVVSSIDLDDLRANRDLDLEVAPAVRGSQVGTVGDDSGMSIEERLRSMWRELLGLDDLGDHEDFFEVGGHSLIAIRLLSRIRAETGVRLQLTDLFEGSTIAALAALLNARVPNGSDTDGDVLVGKDAAPALNDSADHPRLVAITTGGDEPALHVVHGAGGGVLFMRNFARQFLDDRPVMGFQACGVRRDEVPDVSVEAMADRYVRELRAQHPPPYQLAGYSGGGIVALEMARRLRPDELSEPIVLFDSVPPRLGTPGALRRWRRVLSHLRREGTDPLKPFLHATLRRRLDMALLGTDGEMVPAPLDDTDFLDLFGQLSAVFEAHRLAPVDVDVLVVRADEVWPTQPVDYHWGGLVRSVHTVRARGNHQSMFDAEYVAGLADAVRPFLARSSAS